MKSLPRLLLVTLLLSAPAFAASMPKTKNPYIPQVQQRYRSLDIDKAMEALDQAMEWPGNGPAELVWLELMRGVLYFQLEETDNAVNAFKRAFALDKRATLPVSKPSSKLRKLFDQARKDFASAVASAGKKGPRTADAPPPPDETASPPPDAASIVANATTAPRLVTDAPLAATPAPSSALSVTRRGPPPPRPWAWATLGGGAAVALAGGALLYVSRDVDRQLRAGTLKVTSESELDAKVAWGQTSQTMALSLLGAGAAGLIAGTVMALAPSSDVQVSAVVTGSGAAAVVSGRLP